MKARRPRHSLSCSRKTGYPTRAAAEAAMRHVVEETGSCPTRWRVYKCSSCKLWHWGRLPGH